jgi:hypothetical protein
VPAVQAPVVPVPPTPLLPGIPELICFDVSRDGKRFLIDQLTGPTPSVELVQRWTAALKK